MRGVVGALRCRSLPELAPELCWAGGVLGEGVALQHPSALQQQLEWHSGAGGHSGAGFPFVWVP